MGMFTTGSSSSSESKLAIFRSSDAIIGEDWPSFIVFGCAFICTIGGSCPGALLPLEAIAFSRKGSCLGGDIGTGDRLVDCLA
jgi:hypothetical protein